jgi:hypothetical protein
MMLPNIEKMKLPELQALKSQINSRLPEAKRELIVDLRKKVDEIAEQHGLTAKDILNGNRGRPPGSKSKPTVRRGRPPGSKNKAKAK